MLADRLKTSPPPKKPRRLRWWERLPKEQQAELRKLAYYFITGQLPTHYSVRDLCREALQELHIDTTYPSFQDFIHAMRAEIDGLETQFGR